MAAALHPGWGLLDAEADLPCFARPIVRRHRPLRPVGIERASPEAQARWAADGYPYQVNNYEDAAFIWDATLERGRPPDPESAMHSWALLACISRAV